MIGTSATTFSPNTNFSRAMMTATLFRIYHGRLANASDSRANPFRDVPETSWFAPYITWAYNANIVLGMGDGTFAPHISVDAQQFITMLYRYANPAEDEDESPELSAQQRSIAENNDVPDWAADALIWGLYHELIDYNPATIVPFSAFVSRAEIATIITVFIRNELQSS